MITMLGLPLAATSNPKGGIFVPLTEITINNFSRDMTLFDSGAAFGRAEAEVALGGTGTPGETVEIRILPEGGAPTDWEVFGVIDAGGNWSGNRVFGRGPDWLRVEARIQSEPVTRATTGHRFGVGHVIALWGQSEVVRLHSTFYDQLPAETLLSEDSVQAMWFDGGPQIKHLTDADPHTAALAAMANVFMAERPGEKFALVFQAVAGTGFRDLVDDGEPSRLWANDAALHAFATADGQHVGMPSLSWFATPGSFAGSYEQGLFPLFTGKQEDGSAVSFPTTINFGTSSSYKADHWFGELYDPAHTRWIAFGPHKFDIGADMQNATVLSGGATENNLLNKQLARESWREMVVNPNADALFLPLGLEPLTYQNGYDDGAGSWTDQSHPSAWTDDGSPMFGRLMAHAILQSSGLTNWAMPVFDQAEWQPAGAYVEVWSSAGDITTPRLKRGLPALGNTQPHWTDVMGWQINGQPAQRAEIVAGRVRIYPNAGIFVSSDVIRFGEGGATGMVKFPEDHFAGTHLNLPVVDHALSGIDGVPVRPLPDEAVLANTLPAPAGGFSTSTTGPYFYDPQTLGAGVSAMQFHFDLQPTVPASGAIMLMTTTGNYLRLEVLPNGKLRVRVRDTGGVVHVDYAQTASGTIINGVQADIRLAIDLAAGYTRIWVNGAQVMDESFTSATPTLPSNRAVNLLATFNGSNQVVANVDRIAVWKEALGDGSLPGTTPYKEYLGPPTLINADPWKLGSDAT
ncbi:MAG: hypothetical protein AAF340_03835 [Pseudomonadota bacterium]